MNILLPTMKTVTESVDSDLVNEDDGKNNTYWTIGSARRASEVPY